MRLEDLNTSGDGRLWSPSAERNKQPIADVLLQVLPQSGLVLEIGSGTGEHVVHFARTMPSITWQPSEQDKDCLRSIPLPLRQVIDWRTTDRMRGQN